MLERNADQQSRNGQVPQQLQQQQPIDNSLPIENVYIARGITRNQANALRDSIGAANVSGQNDGRNYAMTSNAAGNDNAPAVANQQVVAKAQSQQGQNAARSFRQEYSVLVNRSDGPSNGLVKSKAVDTVRLQAAQQPEAPASQSLDDKDDNRRASARGRGAPAQSQAAPAARQVAESDRSVQKTIEPLDKVGQTAAPATQPSDEPVDVVIIVQRALAPSATQPVTTQPATQPAGDTPQVNR